VTVQRHGLLTLNQAAYAELDAPEAVELLYARRERVIGLRAAAASAPDAYRVRKSGVGAGFLVSGRAFTRHYGIPTDVGRRYRATMIDDVLTVDLRNVVQERRRFSTTSMPSSGHATRAPGVVPEHREDPQR
jgi:hypothetical protein